MPAAAEFGAVVAAGAAVVFIAVFALAQVPRLAAGLSRAVADGSVRRVLIAIAVSLGVVIAVNTAATGGPGSSISFSQAGALRWIVSPVVYAAFLLVVAFRPDRARPKAPWPAWAICLTLALIASTFFSPMSGAAFTTTTLAQGIALLGGFVLFYVAGTRAVGWTPTSERVFVVVVLGAGGAAGLLSLNTGVFSALVIPAAVGLVYVALRGARWGLVLVVAGVWIIVKGIIANNAAVDPSDAQYAQLAVGAAVVLFALLPLRARLPLAVLGGIVGAVEFARSEVLQLSLGIGADRSDVTLGQRAYETHQVFAALAHSPITALLGTGPGGTVDLSSAPDASTLLSSGRVLDAVPTVHLLSTYMLLKLGAVGLLVLLLIVIAIMREAAWIMRAKKPQPFRVLLVLLALAGLAQAAPAATFLFSNPLPALCLGILAAARTRDRAKERQGDAEMAGAPVSARDDAAPSAPITRF